jgi:hypothetical protein
MGDRASMSNCHPLVRRVGERLTGVIRGGVTSGAYIRPAALAEYPCHKYNTRRFSYLNPFFRFFRTPRIGFPA